MARKMILVDPRTLEKPEPNPPLRDPLTNSLTNLDQEIREILEAEGVTDHEKMQRYQQTLRRYLTLSDQYRTRPLGRVEVVHPNQQSDLVSGIEKSARETTPTMDTENVSKTEKRVLDAVPKTMRKKTKLLLDHIKEMSDISWNEQGEITVGGQTLKGSNLTDLVNDVLRYRKHREDPYGWEVFAAALKRANVPRELIGHSRRWEWMGKEREKRRPTSQPPKSVIHQSTPQPQIRKGVKREPRARLKAERGWESF